MMRERWLPGMLVLLGAVLLYLPGLGATDLWAPDEPRTAQVAEELRAGAGHRVLLHLNGAPYTQKPPLYFWLAALAGTPVDRVTAQAARLPSALAGVASVALTLALGASLLGRRTGVAAAALLLTLPSWARLARRAQLDVLLALLELVALAAYARSSGLATPRRRDLASMHAALGLAALVKGPVALLVPGLALVAHRLWERRPRALRAIAPPACLLLSLGPGLAWLAASGALAPSGFLGAAVGENLFGRFFLGTSHARPLLYYLRQLPVDFLPWTLLWPAVAVVSRRVFANPESRRASAWRLLLCWVGAALLFFSLSAGKRGLYLVPVFPALALLCADAVCTLLPERGDRPRWEKAFAGLLLACAVAGAAALPQLFARHGLAAPGGASLALVAAAALALAVRRRLHERPLAAFGATLGLVWGVECVAAFLVLPAIDPLKSPRPVAEAAARLAPADTPVATARASLVGALRYYGDRRIHAIGSESDFAAFLSGGGRVLVVPASELGVATRLVPVEVHARLREGARTLLVVTPLASTDGRTPIQGYAPPVMAGAAR